MKPVLNTKYDPILERKPHNPFQVNFCCIGSISADRLTDLQGMKPVPPKFDPFHISSSFNPPTVNLCHTDSV